ncbi:F-box/kelch-repeat protein At3g23880-like [Cicer arietinum]|uniref:F-box/kelch-repeat protein At3g23880-like n=1 Tax=Cicer arietinum TaxID=3827 RepID=A0A1S2XCC8_CICAR|nr:F-box/kelch-repeat protein At3g23880-like [Cicer arietinum]
MAPMGDADGQNDVAPPDPHTKRQRLNSSTKTLTPPSSSITPGDSLPTLPFELVAEILSRLPVKILMQLRCVCKSWKSLICDPKFVKKHLRVSTTRHHLFLTFLNSSREFVLTTYPLSSVFTEITATATQLDYPLNNRNRFDLIVGSCHGILCFALDQRFALLWNPSISKFAKLPSLNNPSREGSYTIYAFGYAHFSDSYKVVAVSCYESDTNGSTSNRVYKTEVKVHTLGTNSWRRIQDFPSGVPFDESGKFVNGTVNWLASTDWISSWVIVSLDLEKESYQELLQPDYGGVAVVTLTLGVLRDCLCILSHSDTFSDVWLMKEYGNKNSWTKLFRVPFMEGVGCSPYTKALHISEDDQVLLEFDSKLVVYNSRDGTFKTPQIQNINDWMVPEIYQESLISPCFQQ